MPKPSRQTREPTPEDVPRLRAEADTIRSQLANWEGTTEWRARAAGALRVKERQLQQLEGQPVDYRRGDLGLLLVAYDLLRSLRNEVDMDPDELRSIARIEAHLRARSTAD